MTPHSVKEEMDRIYRHYGPRVADLFNQNIWSQVYPLLDQAVTFEFGNVELTQEHVDFGLEMLRRGMFQFPYTVTFFSGAALPGSGLLCVGRNADDKLMDTKYSTAVVACGPVRTKAGMHKGGVPMLLTAYDERTDSLQWKSLSDEGSFHFQKTHESLTDVDLKESSRMSMHSAIGLTAMLLSKEVEQIVVPAPVKLNIRRARKGLSPIGERRIIKIRPPHWIRAEYGPQGERRSPKMHWRRGHFRRYRSGLVVPIPPVLVNGTEDAKSTLRPKDYKLTHQAAPQIGGNANLQAILEKGSKSI